jgi:hypothetical protein
MLGGPSPLNLFEHCKNGPRNELAVIQVVHRDFANATCMVDANLGHTTIQIAAREADFSDRVPLHAATVPKHNTRFVNAQRPA